MWLYHHSRICQPSSFPRKPISSAKGLTWHISIYCIPPHNPEKIHFPPKRGGTTFGCWKQPDYIYIYIHTYTHIYIYTQGLVSPTKTKHSFPLYFYSCFLGGKIGQFFWNQHIADGIDFIFGITHQTLAFPSIVSSLESWASSPPKKIAYICIHLSRIKCGSKWLLFPYFAA